MGKYFAPLALFRLLMQARRLQHRPARASALLAMTLGFAVLSWLRQKAVEPRARQRLAAR